MRKCQVDDDTKSQFPHPLQVGKPAFEKNVIFLAPKIFIKKLPYILQNHLKIYKIGQADNQLFVHDGFPYVQSIGHYFG